MLIGAFAVFPLLGFSVNTLSLFGLVLAIGLVVDDAIVVVEAVEHHIEHGLSPKDATLKAMSEVSGPVMAIALMDAWLGQRALRGRAITACFLEGHGELPMDNFEYHTHLESGAGHSHDDASSQVVEMPGHGVGRLRRALVRVSRAVKAATGTAAGTGL